MTINVARCQALTQKAITSNVAYEELLRCIYWMLAKLLVVKRPS